MNRLRDQRCLNHASRQAAARCLSCGHHFCRECITEHANRLICADCLRKLVAGSGTQRPSRLAAMRRAAQIALGLALLWLAFSTVGKLFSSIPDSFHSGVVWEEGF